MHVKHHSISDYGSEDTSDGKIANQDVAGLIYSLLEHESFGVLCTQMEGKPHGSLVAYVFAKDMKSFFFATPRETRKYRYLTQCDRVALVVDTRDKFPDDTSKIEAVTIRGSGREVESSLEFDSLAKLYIKRHPNLELFTDNKTMVFFVIDVEQITYVTEFQKVYYWTPPDQ